MQLPKLCGTVLDSLWPVKQSGWEQQLSIVYVRCYSSLEQCFAGICGDVFPDPANVWDVMIAISGDVVDLLLHG